MSPEMKTFFGNLLVAEGVIFLDALLELLYGVITQLDNISFWRSPDNLWGGWGGGWDEQVDKGRMVIEHSKGSMGIEYSSFNFKNQLAWRRRTKEVGIFL